MKRYLTLVPLILFLSLCWFRMDLSGVVLKKSGVEYESEREKKNIEKAWEQYFQMMKDPVLGYVPSERLLPIWKDIQENANAKTTAAIAGVTWTEHGPTNVGGRTRAIMIDPNDGTKRTIWAAGVNGGIWKCTDITATTPVWTAIDNFMTNLAVTGLVSDPTNPSVFYACTGEGYFNVDAARGAGVFKSTDGGATWAQLPSTTGFTRCQRILVTPTGTVLVAERNNGLQRSINGGTTWTKVLGTGLGITGAASNFAYDVDVAADGSIFATLDGSVHKSTNDGATFGAAQTLPVTLGRVEIACAPNDANYAYALIENGNVVNGIARTTNGGTTWTARTEPDDADPGIPNTDFSRGQAWYDLSIAVNPTNRDMLYVGGVDLFRSSDGAGTWTQVAHWYGGFGFQYVHADQHFIVYEPGNPNVVYFGNDGGIYRSANAAAGTPTISDRNNSYNVTQFYACALHPTAGTFYALAGAQDNGSHQFNNPGLNATVEVTGGDGAFCHIDQDNPLTQITSYVFQDYYVSTNCGNSFTNFSTGGGNFINITDYDNTANLLYCRNGNNNYTRMTTAGAFTTIGVAGFGGAVTAIKCNNATANRVFFGIDNGDVFRVDNANTGAPTATNISTGLPAGNVSCIETEIGNDNHIIVTYSNYGLNSIWESINGGTTWTSIEGNLPDMPVWWALINPNNTDQLLIGTELGAWSTDNINAGATNWGVSSAGMANTRVSMLQMRTSDNLVLASTHGRGLFSTDIFCNPNADFTVNAQVGYVGQVLNFTDMSLKSTSWNWNFGDASSSALKNPTKSYAAPGVYTVTLTINGGACGAACTETKVGYITILPQRNTPYLVGDGGNFEINPGDFAPTNLVPTANACGVATGSVIWQRGNSAVTGKNSFTSASNAWVTGLVGNYTVNNETHLYTPDFNFSAAGTYTLRFQTKFNTESTFDGLILQYSTDKGTTWSQLNPVVAGGWYNSTAAAGGTYTTGTPFFSGNGSAAYVLKSTDVSTFAGQASVAFRFVFKSDGGVNGPGFAIDDFEILYSGPAAEMLVDLDGAWFGSGALLQWEPSADLPAYQFRLMRSSDGVNFSQIGTFAPGVRTFRYNDGAPFGNRVFYKVAADLPSGEVIWSNTVEMLKDDAEWISSVYPNPFSTELTVRFSTVYSEPVTVSIYDAVGVRIFDSVFDGNVPAIYLDQISGALTSGTYFLHVRQGSRSVVRKLIRE